MWNSIILQCLLSILLLTLFQAPHYIVYLGSFEGGRPLISGHEDVTRSHHNMISSMSTRDENGVDPLKRLIYSYTKIFNAFAATLHEDEVMELANHPDVISIFESRNVRRQTIHSWDFLSSFQHKSSSSKDSIWEKANYAEDIIIAAFDTGKKLIGARYFVKGFMESVVCLPQESPRDMEGHGTHTLSTAGGNKVWRSGSSTVFRSLGLKNGTIKGGASNARLASYKVLWPECRTPDKQDIGEGSYVDALAAMEAAVTDGVDIINLSMSFASGLLNTMPHDARFYFEDAISIATFHAMTNGILPVVAAGNEGPTPSSVGTVAPWVLTVGASTIDRDFVCYVTLGNNLKIRVCVACILNETTYYPLITGATASVAEADPINASYCVSGTLDPVKVKGRILVCLIGEGPINTEITTSQGYEAVTAGAVGLIIANDQFVGAKLLPDYMMAIPTAHVNFKDGQAIFSYINTTSTPNALITNATTELGIEPSPIVASFSCRGPNIITPDILKPDVIAPGVSIMSAYSKAKVPSSYFPLSARPVDNTENPILDDDPNIHTATPFATGAGLVQPELAMDPGLVYDMNQNDYLFFLCALPGFNATILKTFAKQHTYQCPKSSSLLNFNYPSITISEFTGAATATRRLKNVGEPSTYTARVETPTGISVVVEPKTLIFSQKDQEIPFQLVFSADVSHLPSHYTFGSLVWSDGRHSVRSPIVVKGKSSSTPKTPT
ncbi:Subtilisin-like protease SBT5.4 [Bienertia sinuspersici]